MTSLKKRVSSTVDFVVAELERRRVRPRATYRLEFHKQHFRFTDATAIIPYLKELGISHVYSAPYFQVQSEAAHGYAIVDFSQLNPELGTREEYDQFVAALHAQGMGQILDFVPNHMAAAPGENKWWTDVLEHGQSSRFADFFDIEWQPTQASLENRILLPILGDQFGKVLEAGELSLKYAEGSFFITYYNRRLPLDPSSYSLILSRVAEFFETTTPAAENQLEFESILTAISHLPARTTPDPAERELRIREQQVIKWRLNALFARCESLAAALEGRLRELNGKAEDTGSFDELEELLNLQVYRLSHWKAASDEVNYRRFFDINELVAISVERLDVFEESHCLVLELLARGDVDGLRIDHVDGLYDPRAYLWRLQWAYVKALGQRFWQQLADEQQSESSHEGWKDVEQEFLQSVSERIQLPLFPDGAQPQETTAGPADAETVSEELSIERQLPLFVVVEKILGPEEPLPLDWPVAGTTGYDFLNQVNGLFVDAEGFAKIRRSYQRFTGEETDFGKIIFRSKGSILQSSMSSELHLLGHRLKRIVNQYRQYRDFTLNTLLAALREIIVSYPVYRTYIGPEGISARDRDVVQRAFRRARRLTSVADHSVFDVINRILLLEDFDSIPEEQQRLHQTFAGRLQQVTSPVMAKGVEDTAFYRFLPLVSVNEVGGHPPVSPVSLWEFHRANEVRARQHPDSLLATTTHDTKRSEDVRSRINVLSEIPEVWRTTLSRWARLNRRFRSNLNGEDAPSRNDEYLFYQTLIGLWPSESPTAEEAHERLVQRVLEYMLKAVHEAKERTSWTNPDPQYEEALEKFVRGALRQDPGNRFLADLLQFQAQTAEAGAISSSSQVLLKLTSPGIPDVYQGQEIWDFSLVDPDNRRAVDYPYRCEILRKILAIEESGCDGLRDFAQQLALHPTQEEFKMFVTAQTLRARRDHSALFSRGTYLPLTVEGPLANHLCAFARVLRGPVTAAAIVVTYRLWESLRLRKSASSITHFPLSEERNAIDFQGVPKGTYRDCFTGQTWSIPETCDLSELMPGFPFKLLFLEHAEDGRPMTFAGEASLR